MLALGLNVVLGHVDNHSSSSLLRSVLGSSSGDPSLYSDHLAVAGALTAGLLFARRPWGLLAVGLTILLGVWRAGAALHYPSVAVGALAGAVCFVALLPLQQPVARLIGVLSPGRSTQTGQPEAPRGGRPGATFQLSPGLAVSALLVMASVLGYALRSVQDRGPIHVGERAESVLQAQAHPGARAPDEFPGMPIREIAAGLYPAAHASVAGDVTQTTHEIDGDIHVRIEQGGTFLVAEIVPELPLPVPRVGEEITAWGIVRHDGIHNWWELHPVVGWAPGDVLIPGRPGAGGGE
jgi:hypothetical protein